MSYYLFRIHFILAKHHNRDQHWQAMWTGSVATNIRYWRFHSTDIPKALCAFPLYFCMISSSFRARAHVVWFTVSRFDIYPLAVNDFFKSLRTQWWYNICPWITICVFRFLCVFEYRQLGTLNNIHSIRSIIVMCLREIDSEKTGANTKNNYNCATATTDWKDE